MEPALDWSSPAISQDDLKRVIERNKRAPREYKRRAGRRRSDGVEGPIATVTLKELDAMVIRIAKAETELMEIKE